MKRKCTICERRPGDKPFNRFGERDPNPDTPLGALDLCESCNTANVCPECLLMRECCEAKGELAVDDPGH